jgi:AcrR family transcriptional regulator
MKRIYGRNLFLLHIYTITYAVKIYRKEVTMPKALDDLDIEIISAAKEFFITKGIRNTEMKDIANAVGIGRSTLYRHFANKEAISFYVAKEILISLGEFADSFDKSDELTGFDKFAHIMKIHMDSLIKNTDKVRFLDEFDQLFTDSYPQSEEAFDFIEFTQRKNVVLSQIFRDGIQDGSIKPVENPEFEVDVISNLIFGLAQRILPRAKHYVEEHGYSNEFLEEAINLILNSIKVI